MQRAAQQQQQKAQALAGKKKLLWGSKKAETNQGPAVEGGREGGEGRVEGAGVSGGAGGGEEEARGDIAGGPREGGGGGEGHGMSGVSSVWASAQLGDSERESKFRKLMVGQLVCSS